MSETPIFNELLGQTPIEALNLKVEPVLGVTALDDLANYFDEDGKPYKHRATTIATTHDEN